MGHLQLHIILVGLRAPLPAHDAVRHSNAPVHPAVFSSSPERLIHAEVSSKAYRHSKTEPAS